MGRFSLPKEDPMSHRLVAGWSALLLAVLLGLTPVAALADGAGGGGGGGNDMGSTKPANPDLAAAVKAIDAKDYSTAIRLLESVVAKDGKNADAYNWLGYATRQGGDPTRAIPIYQKALSLDPKHRGAHEYIGEAYLVLGDLPKAKEHLARLDKLCLLPCEQYTDLKKAVQAYEASGGKVRPIAAPAR
jgi:tetratricopeptide (TPR) repeat protein